MLEADQGEKGGSCERKVTESLIPGKKKGGKGGKKGDLRKKKTKTKTQKKSKREENQRAG